MRARPAWPSSHPPLSPPDLIPPPNTSLHHSTMDLPKPPEQPDERPLTTGLEQVLALPGDAYASWPAARVHAAVEEEEEEKYLPEGDGATPATQGEEALPQAWDPADAWGGSATHGHHHHHHKWQPEATGPYHASLSSDRRTARYVGKANHPQDVGTVKADRPLPRFQAYHYFEVEVLHTGTPESRAATAVTVGLAAKGFPLHRQPGTWVHSYGYRGLDGKVLATLSPEAAGGGGGGEGSTSSRGKDYGPPFGKGDVVGCGVDFVRQEVFYTKNGKHLGVAFRDIFRRQPPPPPPQQPPPQAEGAGAGRRTAGTSWAAAPAPVGRSSTSAVRAPSTSRGTTTAAAPTPASSSSTDSRMSSILRRVFLLSEGAASNAGVAAEASISLGAALRASIRADVGEDEEQDDDEEDEQEAIHEDRRSRGTGTRTRETRSASFSAGSASTTSSSARRTDTSALYDTMRSARRAVGAQQQGPAQGGAAAFASPPAPDLDLDLYPVVSLHGQGDVIHVNFGQEPFRFDLQAKQQADQAAEAAALAGLAVPQEEVQALIRDYLLCAGYQETLQCFNAAVGAKPQATTHTSNEDAEDEKDGEDGSAMDVAADSSSSGKPLKKAAAAAVAGQQKECSTFLQTARERVQCLGGSLAIRKQLQAGIMSEEDGQVAAAMERLATECRQVWRRQPALRFELHCLVFVDLLRRGATAEALAYAQRELAGFASSHPEETDEPKEEEEEGEEGAAMAEDNRMDVEDGKGKAPAPRRRPASSSTSNGDAAGHKKRMALASASPPSPSPLDYAVRLRDAMGLLAYPNVAESPSAHLASHAHRKHVAELVNAAVLQATGEQEGDGYRPMLEEALVQLAAVHETLREVKAGGRGQAFRLPALLSSPSAQE